MSTSDTPERWGVLQWAGTVLLWLWVLVPFGYGLYQLLIKIPALFGT
ncbi:hypothetical protein WEH80_07200 [Actinomycetes bacterium KLBMP 9759]